MLTHYRALSGTDPWYCDKTERMAKLAQRLRDDVQFRKIYCDYVRKHMPKYPLWWEAIKSEGGKELEWP